MAGRIAATLGALGLCVLATPAAQAMEEGWFMELAIGRASFTDVSAADLEEPTRNFFEADLSLNVDSLDGTVKTTDRSYAVISGYRFNENWAMETGFFRLGAFQYRATGTVSDGGGSYPAFFNLSFRAKGVMFGVSGTQPIGDLFEVRGRAGISSSDTRIKFSAGVQSSVLPETKYSASSQDFYIGAGVGMYLWDYYRVGFDWMRHRNIGKPSYTYKANVDNLLLSISYIY